MSENKLEQRFVWIAEVVSYLLSVPQQVIEHMIESDYYNAVEQFVSGYTHQVNNGQCYSALFAFMNQSDEIQIQNNPPPQDFITPVVILTRRMEEGVCQGDAIEEPQQEGEQSAQEYEAHKQYFLSQVNILTTINNPLQTLSTQLSLIYPQLLPSMSESELIFQSRKMAVAAATTDRQLQSHYHIDVPEINVLNVNDAHKDPQLMERILKAVTGFNDVFRQALNKLNAMQPIDELPVSEIELWRQKAATIGTLYENMFTPDFKTIVQILDKVTNDEVKLFQQLRQDVSKACLEARDNTRFLQTLERHFKQLQRAEIAQLPEIINSLYSAIRMVWTISRYYNTEERLQPLLMRISKQLNLRIINNCNVATLFDQEKTAPSVALGVLDASEAVLARWVAGYAETRERIQEQNKEAPRWEFDRALLFGETQFIIGRLKQLKKCCEKINEFGHIISAEVQNVTGDISGVRRVRNQMQNLSNGLIAFNTKVYSQDSADDEEFENLIVQFDQNVRQVEQQAFQFIDDSFSKLRSVSTALDLVVKIQENDSGGDLLQKHMATKIEKIIGQYCQELERSYDEYSKLNANPPTGVDLPKVAGSLVWARSLFVAVRDPHNIIAKLIQKEPEFAKKEIVEKASKLYAKLKSALRTFEAEQFKSWRDQTECTIRDSLGSPLLGERLIQDIDELRSGTKRPTVPPEVVQIIQQKLSSDGDQLPMSDQTSDMTGARYNTPSVSALMLQLCGHEMCVNFPSQLNELIDEVKILDRLGFDVGETALNVALQKQKYEKHAEGLKNLISNINSSLKDYVNDVSVKDFLSDTINNKSPYVLIISAVKKCAVVIRQGFGPLNWNSLSVEDYLENANSQASQLDTICKSISKTIESINQNIHQIKNMKLTPSQQILFQGSELSYAAPSGGAGAPNLALSIDPKQMKLMAKKGQEPTAMYAEALKQAELRAAAKDEHLYEEMAYLSVSDFISRMKSYRERQLSSALEKYQMLTGLFHKIRQLASIEGSSETDVKCPQLAAYYKYWAENHVFGAIIFMVRVALQDYYSLIRGLTLGAKDASVSEKFLKATYTPLFNIQTMLQSGDIITTPEIEQLRQYMQNQVTEIKAAAMPFVLWEDQTAQMQAEYFQTESDVNQVIVKRGQLVKYRLDQKNKESANVNEEVYVKSFYYSINTNDQIIKLCATITDKISQTIEDLKLYREAWFNFEQIWKIQRVAAVTALQQLETDNFEVDKKVIRRKGDLTANELNKILYFFITTAENLQNGFNEKMFIINHSQMKQKNNLLTDLATQSPNDENKKENEDVTATLVATNGNPFDQSNPFDQPNLEKSLLLGLPTSCCIQTHPPYRCIIDFCVLDSGQLVEQIIKECNYWRDAIIRVVIEKARPKLVEVYQEIENEMTSITQNCNKDLNVLKSVLATIVRVQSKTMALELKVNNIKSYYNVIENIKAYVPISNEHHEQIMKKYIVNNENEQLNETIKYVDFGYSLSSVQQLLSISETCQELCNDEVKALLNQQQIQTQQQNSFLSTTKKQFKTVNCKVYDVELVAVDDVMRKWECLQVLVGLVDQTLESTKTKFSQITKQDGKNFEANLMKFIDEFNKTNYDIEINQYKAELDRQKVDSTYQPKKSIMEVMNSANDNMNMFKEKLAILNKEKEETLLAQKLFDLPLTDLADLPSIEKKLQIQTQIFEQYNIIKDQFEEWAKQKFNLLDTNKLEVGCNQLRNSLRKLSDACQFATTYEFCQLMVENYKSSIPLLTKLTSEALRERHWKNIEETCHTQFQGQENDLTLGSIIKLNLQLYENEISEIVLYAEKEAVIEKDLTMIKHKWQQTHFPLKKHENIKGQDKCYILQSLEPIITMIDEHSISLQTMSSQKYVAFFAQEVRQWERNMQDVSDTLEAWVNCQRQFLYLEGIFDASEDLRVQLPDEFKRYDAINKAFVGMMQEVFKQNHPVLDTCKQPNRLKFIKDLIGNMEKCQKTLTNYLNSKRSKYQRFYFISDEELLSVLGRASNPIEVQPQIRKMFDNVASLEFPRVNNLVVGMNSPEGEQLLFQQPINIEKGEAIESWMSKIDAEMQESLRILIKTGLYDFGHNYTTQPRIKWIHKHLCQVCIVGSEVYHTWDCEEAFRGIEKGEHNAMKRYLQRKTDHINELVAEVRTDLSKQARIKVNTLLIVDIHSQTIIDNLIKQNTTSPKEFLYESQLRFYYSAKTDNLQIVQNTPPYHPYLFEYQGLSGRLVVTPLTDRMIMTITNAINKRYHSSASGPAGTGKTETVKDLSKQLGRMCVVVNCSGEVDTQAIGATLSGSCESGCWICFDEFNRIEPAVLSVVSQQVKIILQGMAQCVSLDGKSIPSAKIILEGREITVKQTSGIFCTMNPGYAGRSELPDNLKALFRPIVMVKPNLNIICENMLFSEGFTQARVLSMKMTVLYKLASEQLSKQFHYDFGLRALKSVLVNAGKLKRQAPDEDEEKLLMTALRDMNLPKFVFEDVPLFEGLITDLCPGIKMDEGSDIAAAALAGGAPQRGDGEEVLTMKVAATRALTEMSMEILPDQVGKIVQFYDTLNARHSVMLVGPTGGGKSVIRDAYCRAHTMMGVETTCKILNPKAQTVNELYGVLDLDTREWKDGMLSKIFRTMNDPELAKKGNTIQQFIYFDGDVDAIWIENMNSVMDDNKLLTLPNNERIRMIDNCRLVFEVADLQHASPATVSRCGMVWVDTKNLGFAPRYNKWVRERFVERDKDDEPNKLAEAQQTMYALFEKYINPLIQFIYSGTRANQAANPDEAGDPLTLSQPVTDLNMVNQFCNFFDDCVAKATQPEDNSIVYPGGQTSPPVKTTILNDPTVCEALYVFCIVWSLGACICDADKSEFDAYLKEISNMSFKQNVDISEMINSSMLPSGKITSSRGNGLGEQPTSMLYDFYYDLRKQSWVSWSNFVQDYVAPPDRRFASIFVQNLDTVRNTWILDTFVKARRNVLFIGESGTAKTTVVKTFLENMNAEQYSSLSLNFSSRTASLEVQNAIESNLDRRTKDTLGPQGRKRLVFFVDNISMPVIDQYGTQQPMAMLKLFIEKGGFYDRSPAQLGWKNVVDVQSVGCLPPPGGSNNKLDPRFVSLFMNLNIAVPNDETIAHIFHSIFSEHLRFHGFKFDTASEDSNKLAINHFSQRLTQVTIEIYKDIQRSLSPTPSRFHYLFNLRDISRVFEGMLMSNANNNRAQLLKMWRNEFTRVFCDRLINDEDRQIVEAKITQNITQLVTESTATSSDDFSSCLQNPLIFGDFREMTKMLENYESIYNDADPELVCNQVYEELINGEPICKVITKEDGSKVTVKPQKQFEDDTTPYRLVRILATAAIDMYDNLSKIKAKEKLRLTPLNNIVLFDDALQHLLRIHRVIRTPKGSALLIGFGGSGRRSLTRLATFMAGYRLFEIQLAKNYGETEFKLDLQRIYRDYLAPPKLVDEHVVFLFTDQHVADESFLEYINSILTTGIVPGLFEESERTGFISEVSDMAKKAGVPETKEAVWQFFVNSCRERLHIVLSMSPVGDALRKRCRAFPGMISATTIDWYDSWSDDGLKAVAKTILFDQQGTSGIQVVDEQILAQTPQDQRNEVKATLQKAIIDFALFVHKTSVQLSDDFWAAVRRKNFVTPRNFVDFLQNYLEILQQKRNECNVDINKFKSGLEKLDKANEDVLVMNEKLGEQKVVVEAKTAEVDKMVAELSVKTAEITELQEVISTQEKELNVKIEQINKDSAEAQEELAKAQPALEAAIKALDDITPKDIQEIQIMKVPSAVMDDLCGCVYGLMKGSTNINWADTKALMCKSSFLSDIVNFNFEVLNDKTINHTVKVLKKYTKEQAKASFAALVCIYTWLTNIVGYYEVYKIVAPKQKNVKLQQEKKEASEKELKKLQEKIAKIDAEANLLKSQLETQQAEQKELNDTMVRMKAQLEAAQQLINDLGSEKIRWAAQQETLGTVFNNYIGDCLLTSAFMNYCGGYNNEFRAQFIEKISDAVLERKIPTSVEKGQPVRPEQLLISDVEVLKWGSEGLPGDQLSVQNGTLITRTSKWPLIIDPQLQAGRWIKEKEKSRKLVVVSQNDTELMRHLEQSVILGTPILIENVGEQLDPALSPILEKDIHVSPTGQKQVKIGSKDVDYDPNFQLYMTTKIFNPNYTPDVFSTLCVVNHCVTENGLEAQLLNAVVKSERPDQEQKRQQNVKIMSDSNQSLKQYEESLLRILSQSSGPIVENYELIDALKTTKSNVSKIQQLLKSLQQTSAEIEEIRMQYMPVAIRGRVCYFAMASLAQINGMYQYSLQSFMDIFMKSLVDAPIDSNIEQRIANIINKLTDNVYIYVCTSLFEKHKLMFSFLLTTRIIQAEKPNNTLPTAEVDFFVKGDISLDECALPNPHNWITQTGWKDLVKLAAILKGESVNQADSNLFIGTMAQNAEKLEGQDVKHATITSDIFADLINDVTNNDKEWKAYWDSERPEQLPLPGKIGENPFITDLQKLCILRCLRPDRVYIAVSIFISNVLGEKYITPPVLNYDYIYNSSTRSTPIVFIITPGSDPLNEIIKLAQRKDMAQRFQFVALGQGQSPIAESYLKSGLPRGQWILLMNSHLLPKWLQKLEKMMEPVINCESLIQQMQSTETEDAERIAFQIQELDKKYHPQFRLFMTTEPTDKFPLSILQNSIKIVTEPPNSLRLNMLQTFQRITADQLDECPSPHFKPLVYSLAFFHAAIQERQKYGKVGWNVKYDFNDSDFQISMDCLNTYLQKACLQNEDIPWQSIRYLIGEVNYGGRVMDDWDRRLINCYLEEFFGDFVFDADSQFSFYKSPDFDYAPIPAFALDTSINAQSAYKKVLTQLLECSFQRFGHAGISDTNDFINEYTKANHSIKEVYEEYFINKIPLISSPEVFGLHTNAEIQYLEQSTREMWINLAELQPRSTSSDSISREDYLLGVCNTIQQKLPQKMNYGRVYKKLNAKNYIMPTEIVLLQEIERYNVLVTIIKDNIDDLIKALKGEIGMSLDLDAMANSLYIGQLPQRWRKYCPATLKALSTWLQHLQGRADQYETWYQKGEPAVIWLSGFHIPESYLTALVQTCSRIKRWPLDRSALFTVVTGLQSEADVKGRLEFGCYIKGLYMEGAGWNEEKQCLCPSRQKELIIQLPLVKVIPAETSRIKLRNQFKTPVYVTTARTNAMGVGLVFAADVQSFEHESHWILQGVAIVLNDN